jgi:hypothetical protein
MRDIQPGDAVSYWVGRRGRSAQRQWARLVSIGDDAARVELPQGHYPRIQQIAIARLNHHREYGVVAVDEL